MLVTLAEDLDVGGIVTFAIFRPGAATGRKAARRTTRAVTVSGGR